MNITKHHRLACAGLACALVATLLGCSDAESLVEAQHLQATLLGTKTAEIEQRPVGINPPKKAFRPLNPDRKNPFLYGGDAEMGEVITAKSLSSIRVLGFLKAHKQRVVLAIDDQTLTLAVGDSALGIEVIEIEPPLVTVRSAEATWTASMFETPVRTTPNVVRTTPNAPAI